MLPKTPSSKPIAHYLNFAAIARSIRGSTASPLIRPKNHLVTRGRRPPSTDVDIDDADYRDDADLSA